MSHYRAPWERSLRVGSALLTAILVGVAVGLVVLGLSLSGPTPEQLYPLLVPAVAVLAVLAGAWLLAPRGYAVEATGLVVERRLGTIRIPLHAIRAVSLLPEGFGGAVRVGGNGGLFGYSGWWWSRRLGAFRLYATRRTDLVRVGTDQDVFVLSPADPERFADELLARAPAARRATGAEGFSPRKLPRGRALRVLGLAALLLLLVVGSIFAALWGFSPTAVSVQGEVVRVDRRWASPVDLPLVRIHSVEQVASQYGRRWWRTNGTSMGAVRYGRFGSRELGSFRLYAWRYGPYVLLETDEGRVLLTPDDPERFVVEVRERLGTR